ncbi:transcriptional repressor [Campylobacter sp. faydin G-24]|uniref:Transcriptional repressor n=1 Tax=Campylobacter anatolicus TaxID=2829105 RepID=A0ABS5HKC7_9BACT|nr:transcriptional repressor [Campylobacter anatolicus]MBR8461311.1 transcriptional repressor [Campylobacter anatolicus]MBR8464506.1 transcriptional repressor [Campylobacter anatolicus]MBR8466281.1 transcriptional repressor [Campylobacter anatolicus]
MDIQNFLSEHNIRPTTLRVQIVKALNESQIPLSYDEILQSLKANKTTIYRTMELLEEQGLIVRTENNHKSYYEFADGAKAYFICDVCHKITNIEVPILPQAKIVKSAVIKGICEECDHS